jgi:hypothetical protein
LEFFTLTTQFAFGQGMRLPSYLPEKYSQFSGVIISADT